MDRICDFLVIGSGIAGLSFAIKAAELGEVILVTKKGRMDNATNLAQGGIAAVLDPEDSFAEHIADTHKAGAGLCHHPVVRMTVEGGPARIAELLAMGVEFQQNGAGGGALDLAQEGGHGRRRIAHAFDHTGSRVEEVLLKKALENKRISLLEDHLAIDLLLASKTGCGLVSPGKFGSGQDIPGKDRCLGAYVLSRQSGRIERVGARLTVLCSGGSGKVYLYTTNPDTATGDGIAMAYRAGARIANLEFVQFHPTCLYHHQNKNFLISEAVRGEGARLVDRQGRCFMQKYDPRAELATRDTVARAIDMELKASGEDCVYLDISHQPGHFLRRRFPNIYQTCFDLGIDMTKEPIPVVPAAHYMCGGVQSDSYGRSSLENLLVIGETACTGLHGANRLASNSLLEALVFAHRAAMFCKENWQTLCRQELPEASPWKSGQAEPIAEAVLISHNWDQIRRLMWNYVGIVRSEKRLSLAKEQLIGIIAEVDRHYRDYLPTPDLIELRNIALVAGLIVRSAIERKESRGLHYNSNYPQTDDLNWKKDTVISLDPVL